jgi:hypothetical protein
MQFSKDYGSDEGSACESIDVTIPASPETRLGRREREQQKLHDIDADLHGDRRFDALRAVVGPAATHSDQCLHQRMIPAPAEVHEAKQQRAGGNRDDGGQLAIRAKGTQFALNQSANSLISPGSGRCGGMRGCFWLDHDKHGGSQWQYSGT